MTLVSLFIFPFAVATTSFAFECVGEEYNNCLQCHAGPGGQTPGPVPYPHGYLHQNPLEHKELYDSHSCLTCHCGDPVTSPCVGIPYEPVETQCCTSCHDCFNVNEHTWRDNGYDCGSCHFPPGPPGDCLSDMDIDDVPDDNDNCPEAFNPNQEDANGDGIGDACSGVPIYIGDFWANCGDVGIKIDICLQNLEVPVGGFQMDICENPYRGCSISGGTCNDDSDCPSGPTDTCEIIGADPDCLTCVECELTERTTVFDCVVNELDNGCCRIILFAKHPGGLINPGECDIVTIVYEIKDSEECCDECIEIDGTNIVVVDEYGYQVDAVIGDLGTVCPFVCGDVYPGESSPGAGDCGDGVIDLFDILEEVGFALGTDTPDDCQGNPTGPRDDVPTGTPIILPVQCLDPDVVINILDVMVIIDMALNRQDCCSYYYAGVIISSNNLISA